MYCPACTEPMIVLEYDRLEVDYCGGCRGVWLDTGELELLYGDTSACDRLMAAGGASERRTRRRCPQCGQKMDEWLTGGERPVAYDRCPRGHGLWFDRGELNTVLVHGRPEDADHRLWEFLRAVFPEEAPEA